MSRTTKPTTTTILHSNMLKEIRGYQVCGPIAGVCKQSAVWVEGQTADGVNCLTPIVYLQRPKWIKDDHVWEKICESVTINIPEKLLVCPQEI